jgi:hypothetical protein
MFPEFAKQVLKPLSEFAKFTDETGMISEVDLGIPLERELYVSEISGLVIFEPKVRYNAQISSNPLTSTTLFDIESNTIYLRDSNLENKFVSFLKDLHPSFTNTAAQGYFSLKHSQFTAGNWFLETFGQLEKCGIKVYGLDKLTLKRYSPFPASISMNVSSNSDWFEINTQLKFGDYAVKLKDIRQAVLSDERFVRLGDGSLGQIPDKWLRKFSKLIQSSEVDGEKVKLSKIHFSLLTDFEEDISSPAVEKELAEKKARLQSFEEIRTVEVPKGIQAELRNYQKAGLNWLNFLQEYSWGGILADDMGYGDVRALNPNSGTPTTNIDQLLNEGMHFTDAHSNAAVCTPTRYGLLTGRYAFRTRLKSGVLVGYDPPLIAEERLTLGGLFSEASYNTAAIGKWHLGLDWPKKNTTLPLLDGDQWSDPGTENVDYDGQIGGGPTERGFDYSYIIPSSLDIAPYCYISNGKLTKPITSKIEFDIF